MRTRSMLGTIALAVAVGVAVVVPAPARDSAGEVAAAVCDTSRWTSYDRPATYGVTQQTDVVITMSDGVRLFADVYLPSGAKEKKFPVIVTQSPYGKSMGSARFFVERGYAQVVVSVRGTGTSEGRWHGFDEREQRDGYEIVDWAYRQPWSDGRIGLHGASYMAINQIFTAAQHPPGVKALFPIVPEADAYRDIVFAGGQTNVAFIPVWLALVTGLGLVPGTATLSDPATALQVYGDHVIGITDFQAKTFSEGVLGGDITYDSDYWRTRSPIEVIDQIDVPTFITGGLHDIFQRGEPLLYEALRRRGVPTKLLMGDWGHLGGSSGAGLPVDGVPDLDHLALRWFDQYVRDGDTDAECMPQVTQFLLGDGHFRVQPEWPHPNLAPQMWYLQPGGRLDREPPGVNGGSDRMLQLPVSGVCSHSTNQWVMGALDGTPCDKDNRLTEVLEKTYTTAPLTEDVQLTGPIAARIWTATTAQEAVIVVRLTDVAPDGTSTERTAGLLAASHRATDAPRSRWLRGLDLQPWHPFTLEAVQAVTPGEPMALDVEVFPTNAVFKKGHRLRISVGPSDFPHAASPLPAAISQAGGVLSIFHDAAHASSITLPVVASASSVAEPAPAPAPAGTPAAPGPGSSLPATGGEAATGLAVLLGAVGLALRRVRRAALATSR